MASALLVMGNAVLPVPTPDDEEDDLLLLLAGGGRALLPADLLDDPNERESSEAEATPALPLGTPTRCGVENAKAKANAKSKHKLDLFGSFSSSPCSSPSLWRYSEGPAGAWVSPEVPDPVVVVSGGGGDRPAPSWPLLPEAPAALRGGQQQLHPPERDNDNEEEKEERRFHRAGGPPCVIRCRRLSVCSGLSAGSGGGHGHGLLSPHCSFPSSNGDGDDDVSLLADDPDEDDQCLLPHSTYGVLATVLDGDI